MNTRPRQSPPRYLAWSVACLSLACSACMTAPQSVRSNSPENATLHAIYKETTVDGASAKAARKTRPAAAQLPSPAIPSGGNQPVYRDPALQQIGYVEESNSGVTTAMGMATPMGLDRVSNPAQVDCPGEIVVCPPEPRTPATGFNPLAPGMLVCDSCNIPSPEKYPDEYLCDGGDRELPVHYDSQSRLSLETEDTVIEFTDRKGNERVKPTNRVCIYAPRFASVRTVSRPHEEQSHNEVVGIGQSTVSSGVYGRLKLGHEVQREIMSGVTVRSRVSGLDSEAGTAAASQFQMLAAHDKVLNAFQDLTFVRAGRLHDSEKAELSRGLQAAGLWTRELYPVIQGQTDAAMTGISLEVASSLTLIEEKETAENLRIVKLADKSSAKTGDLIEFTIRYDNLGGREVHHIRIVDNLTPRLVYVDDSATSDRAGKLVLQDNGEGSQVLVWELDEPLPGKTGGVVSFKARVR